MMVAGLFVEEVGSVIGGVGVGERDGGDDDFGQGVLFVGVCEESEDGEAVRREDKNNIYGCTSVVSLRRW